MEFKKKTIIWEDNNEPPKDYLWVRSDGKVYEYSYVSKKWVESKYLSTCGGSGSGCSCPGVMIVEGTPDKHGRFTPNSGSPSFQDAKSFIDQGGIVYLKSPDTMGVLTYVFYDRQQQIMSISTPNGPIVWPGPYVFYGSVRLYPDGIYGFREKNGANPNSAIEMLDGGISVLLSYELDGETIVDDVVGHDVDSDTELAYLYTSRNVRWSTQVG